MHFKKFVSTITSVFVLSGCSTTFELPIQSLNYDELFLRGVFTWWEADDNYKVQKVGDNIYMASARLIADGQPYDFKFADENWTPGLACGPANYSNKSVALTLDKRATAGCDNPSANFQFTPDETGVFEFFIDFSDPYEPEVYVKKAI